MLCVMLKHPKVMTNLDFYKISMIPLEIRAGIRVESDSDRTEDGAYAISCIESCFRKFCMIGGYTLKVNFLL